MSVMRCARCAWYRPKPDAKQGNCVRFPPAAVMIGHIVNQLTRQPAADVRSVFPAVDFDEWCGEWRAKPALGEELPDIVPRSTERMQ